MFNTESYYKDFEDHPDRYAENRKKAEEKFKIYFEVFKYDDYTKELILDLATKTWERTIRWGNTQKYQ